MGLRIVCHILGCRGGRPLRILKCSYRGKFLSAPFPSLTCHVGREPKKLTISDPAIGVIVDEAVAAQGHGLMADHPNDEQDAAIRESPLGETLSEWCATRADFVTSMHASISIGASMLIAANQPGTDPPRRLAGRHNDGTNFGRVRGGRDALNALGARAAYGIGPPRVYGASYAIYGDRRDCGKLTGSPVRRKGCSHHSSRI